eukprot:2554641-Ditylum_brightwellii.AAC.1
MHRLLAKKIACAKKEHEGDGKGKHHGKLESCHKRHHGSGKCHAGKHKNLFCNYHGLCHHDTKECDFYQVCRKHVQPTHCITKQQRLWQVCFVTDVKRHTKKHGLSTKEVKDLNTFVKDKINETTKECDCYMHTMSNFKELSISSSNKSVQSIISDTSVEGPDNESHKPDSKK